MKVTIKTKVGCYYIEVSEDIGKKDDEGFAKRRTDIVYQAKYLAIAVREKIVDPKPKPINTVDMNNDITEPVAALEVLEDEEENEDDHLPF